MIKVGDQVRFVNFEQEERTTVRKFMEDNRARTFTVESFWTGNEHLVFLEDQKNYFQGQCLAVPRFKVGDKVRTTLSSTPYIVSGFSSKLDDGRIHYMVRKVFGDCAKIVSEYDLAFFEDIAEVSVKKDVESTLTQVDVRDGERLVAILYLRPDELHIAIPMLTESYDNVSFRRVDEPPF